MLKNCNHIIIQLLIAAIVSLGIAHAGGDVCPPACTHCGSKVVSACCNDMTVHSDSHTADDHAAAQLTGSQQQPERCEYGSFCPGMADQEEVAAHFTLPKSDHGVVLPPLVSLDVSTTVQYVYIELPQNPPLEHFSSIFTLNCVYLI
jgi:hypothetical protein